MHMPAAMEEDEKREEWDYTIYLVGFPGAASSSKLSDQEKTVFNIPDMLYHLLPQARVVPYSVFGIGFTAAGVLDQDTTQTLKGKVPANDRSEKSVEVVEVHNDVVIAIEGDSPEEATDDWDTLSAASAIMDPPSQISIEKEALDLLERILSDNADLGRIVLAGYGLGGIVVKQAIIAANQTPKYYRIGLSVSKLVFFVTPHHPDNQRGWEQTLLDVIKASDATLHGRLSKVLAELVTSVSQISHAFHRYVAKYATTSFIESDGIGWPEPVIGDLGKLNRTDETCVLWRHTNFRSIANCDMNNMEQMKSLNAHFVLTGPQHYSIFGHFDSESKHNFHEAYFEILQILAPSCRLIFENICLDSLEDIGTLKTMYNSLLDDIPFRNLPQKSSIQVVGPRGCGKSAILKLIAGEMSQTGPAIVIDSLLPVGEKAPTLYSAYVSVLHKIFSQRPSLFYAVWFMVAEIRRHDLWSLDTIQILLEAVLQRNKGLEFLVIVFDYDDWPGALQSWFESLGNLLVSSGSKCTFLVSSQKSIKHSFSPKVYRIDLQMRQRKYWSKFIDDRLTTLFDQSYVSTAFRREHAMVIKKMITTKAKSFQGSFSALDCYLVRLFDSFSLTTPEGIEGKIEGSPKSEEEFFDLEIAALRQNHIDVFYWVASAISWMMWPIRPLRFQELATATAMTLDHSDIDDVQAATSMDIERDLRRHLRFIVSIGANGGRIFSEESKRIFATSSMKRRLALEDDRGLTRLCLHYLRLVLKDLRAHPDDEPLSASGEAEVESATMKPPDTSPAINKAYSSKWMLYVSEVSWRKENLKGEGGILGFLDYACRFWPTHFLRIKDPDQDMKDLVINFLLTPELGQRWFQLYQICHGRDTVSSKNATFEQQIDTTMASSSAVTEPVSDPRDGIEAPSRSRGTPSEHQLAINMASSVGLESIVSELLGTSSTVKFSMVGVRHGFLERNIAVFESDFSYQLECAICNDDAELVFQLLQSVDKDISRCFPLHKAALMGSLQTARVLLNLLSEPFEPDGDGRTPLHCAAAGGHTKVMLVLLGESGDRNELGGTGHSSLINKLDNSNRTPLITALMVGHINAANTLVERGADCTLQDKQGRTALHYAVLACSSAVKHLPLQELADIPDINNCTPLHIAAEIGDAATTSLLVTALDDSGKFGPVINTRSEGKTALHYAAEMGCTDVAKILLRPDSGVDNGIIEEAAELAARRGHISVVSLLTSPTWSNIDSRVLIAASEAGQLLIVQYLLAKAGASPNEEYLGGQSLCMAASKGHVEIARTLLGCGASVNVVDGQRKTPLHHAAEKGRTYMARTLLDREASVDAPDVDRETPLHKAARTGKAGIAKLLLARGANTSARSRTMETPLHLSVCAVEVMEILLQAGAGPNVTDIFSQTPLHHATRKGNVESIKYLLKRNADVDVRDDDMKPPIFYAIERNDVSLVDLLLDAHNHQGKTDIEASGVQWAIESSAPTVFEKLFHNLYAPGQPRTEDQLSSLGKLLHKAAAKRSSEIIGILLEAGADPNFELRNNRPLHIAVQEQQLDNVQTLVKAGALIDERNGAGIVPLHLAVRSNDVRVAQALLDAGADVDALNSLGQSATWLAAFTGKLELITKLLELNPNLDKGDYDGWTPLHVGVDNLEITKLLIGSGANPNRGKQDNYTPLHLATAWKEEQIVKFLLEHDADPRITTDDGRTALHLAVREHSQNMVTSMLEHKGQSCINLRDTEDGKSPFHLALGCTRCSASIVQLLLDHGADPKLNTGNDVSCLELAIDRGDLEPLEALLRVHDNPDSDYTVGKEGLIAAYWRTIKLCKNNENILDLVEVLVDRDARLLEERLPGEGSNGLEACLSRRGKKSEEESLAIRFVRYGLNPFQRHEPGHASAFELGVITRRIVKSKFLRACADKIPKGTNVPTDVKIGFKELRIATEVDGSYLWDKLKDLRALSSADLDDDGWNLDHFIHQACDRVPTSVPPLDESWLTMTSLIRPKLWVQSGLDSEDYFQIEEGGLVAVFNKHHSARTSLRSDHPFPPRQFFTRFSETFFFEVTISNVELNPKDDAQVDTSKPPIVGIGFCGEYSDLAEDFVGWNVWTAGYHGDDGYIYESQSRSSQAFDAKHPFGIGDVVGCGIDYKRDEYYFTLNETLVARRKSKVIYRKLYPTITHRNGPCKITVNFKGGKVFSRPARTASWMMDSFA